MNCSLLKVIYDKLYINRNCEINSYSSRAEQQQQQQREHRAFTRTQIDSTMCNIWSIWTNVTHKPCNACMKSKRNYFFIIMFEFDTRHIVCVNVCVKLVNALFLWKLVRALKLKELLFCVDKFKYKTNYKMYLEWWSMVCKQDKTRGREQKRKEKKLKKSKRKTEKPSESQQLQHQ